MPLILSQLLYVCMQSFMRSGGATVARMSSSEGCVFKSHGSTILSVFETFQHEACKEMLTGLVAQR